MISANIFNCFGVETGVFRILRRWSFVLGLCAISANGGCVIRQMERGDPKGLVVGSGGAVIRDTTQGCNWHISDLRFPEVWRRVSERSGMPAGSRTKVSIFDTGILRHTELLNSGITFDTGYDAVFDIRGHPFPQTRAGFHAWVHGTHTAASLLSPAEKHPETQGPHGIVGVAPHVRFLPIRSTNRIILTNSLLSRLTGNRGNTEIEYERAFQYARSQGVDIISFSLGGLFSGLTLQKIEKITQKAAEAGMIVVATTGHSIPIGRLSFGAPTSPGDTLYTVGVTGSVRGGGIWKHSVPSPKIDIAAPAYPMCWADLRRREDEGPRWPLESFVQVGDGGTSFSTVIVAGALALWLDYHNEEIRSTYSGLARTALAKYVLEKSASYGYAWQNKGFGPGVLNPLALLEVPLPHFAELRSWCKKKKHCVM